MKKIMFLLVYYMFAGNAGMAQSAFFDLSFGTDGKTIIPLGVTENGTFKAVAIQPDGKIVVAGFMAGKAIVARFKQNGTSDTLFATNGFYTYGDFAIFNDIKLQTDGKIIVTGADYNIDGILAIRLNSNGLPDVTFGSGGVDTLFFGLGNATGYSIALLPDGKIVLAGQVISLKIGLVRLKTNGIIDSSFGTNGKVISTYDMAYYVGITPDNKIVVGGHATAAMGYALTAMRFLPDGAVDTSFNHTGTVYTAAGTEGNFGRALTVQPDGKVLLAGSGGFGAAGGNFVVVRYNIDGTLDNSFGSGGITTVDFSGADDAASDIYLAPDGKILLTGSSGPNDTKKVAVARLNNNGTLDNTFCNYGRIIVPLRDITDYGLAVALQSDGRVVVAGNSYRNSGSGNYSDPAIARFLPYPSGIDAIKVPAPALFLYPNPTTDGQLFIVPEVAEKITSITVSDMMGKKNDKVAMISKQAIDISALPNGLYFFSVVCNDGSEMTQKVLVGSNSN